MDGEDHDRAGRRRFLFHAAIVPFLTRLDWLSPTSRDRIDLAPDTTFERISSGRCSSPNSRAKDGSRCGRRASGARRRTSAGD